MNKHKKMAASKMDAKDSRTLPKGHFFSLLAHLRALRGQSMCEAKRMSALTMVGQFIC